MTTTTSDLLEKLSDAWCNALQSDLEHGVSCLNARAATEFHQELQSNLSVEEMLNDLYIEYCDD
jgi:hypothetical protein